MHDLINLNKSAIDIKGQNKHACPWYTNYNYTTMISPQINNGFPLKTTSK